MSLLNTTSLFDIINSTVFVVLQIGIVIGSLGVVLVKRILYSALWLGIVLICVALLYLCLDADFLALAQVLVYVGAVNVVIVFTIMLVGQPDASSQSAWNWGNLTAASTCTGLFVVLFTMILQTPWCHNDPLQPYCASITAQSMSSIEVIGSHLLTDMLLSFELLSLLLLTTLVGAIVVARK